MQQDFKIFQKLYLDNFIILVPLEILSHYPDIDVSFWVRENFQWVMDKISREKLMV